MALRKKSSPKQIVGSFALEFKTEAKDEVVEAAQWYKAQSAGLDNRFLQYLEDVIHIIQHNPHTYKKIYKDFRQAALKKFPYVVVYEIEEDVITVYSVFHAKQNPRKKMNRLNK